MEVMQEIELEVALTDQAAVALDRLIFSMMAEGWECGATNLEVEEMDRLIVEGNSVLGGMRCERCAGPMLYYPFHRGRGYRAVALCRECGERREI